MADGNELSDTVRSFRTLNGGRHALGSIRFWWPEPGTIVVDWLDHDDH